MLLRIFYPIDRVYLTVAIVKGDVYWKAVDFIRILNHGSHTKTILKAYLPDEPIVRLCDIVEWLKHSKVFMITTDQVLKLALGIPTLRRNEQFYNWFLNVKNGVQRFYPETPNEFVKYLFHISSKTSQRPDLGYVLLQPLDEEFCNEHPCKITIPMLLEDCLKKYLMETAADDDGEEDMVTEPSISSSSAAAACRDDSRIVDEDEDVNSLPPSSSSYFRGGEDEIHSRIDDDVPPSDVPMSTAFLIDESKSYYYRDENFGQIYKYCALELNWHVNNTTPISVFPYLDKVDEKFYLFAPVQI